MPCLTHDTLSLILRAGRPASSPDKHRRSPSLLTASQTAATTQRRSRGILTALIESEATCVDTGTSWFYEYVSLLGRRYAGLILVDVAVQGSVGGR